MIAIYLPTTDHFFQLDLTDTIWTLDYVNTARHIASHEFFQPTVYIIRTVLLLLILLKVFFQMLWCIFEGCTNRAWPSQHFLTHACNSKKFWAKLLLLKCFVSATKCLYPKHVSGSVQVLKQWIKVDKLDFFKNAS